MVNVYIAEMEQLMLVQHSSSGWAKQPMKKSMKNMDVARCQRINGTALVYSIKKKQLYCLRDYFNLLYLLLNKSE